MRVTKTIVPTAELTAEQNEVKQQNATVTLPRIHRNRLSRRRSTRRHATTGSGSKASRRSFRRWLHQQQITNTGRDPEVGLVRVRPPRSRSETDRSWSSASPSSDGNAENNGGGPVHCECLQKDRPYMSNGMPSRAVTTEKEVATGRGQSDGNAENKGSGPLRSTGASHPQG